jgi:hypothetical protein
MVESRPVDHADLSFHVLHLEDAKIKFHQSCSAINVEDDDISLQGCHYDLLYTS